MDMKYDSSTMHKLIGATEQRMVEAWNCLANIINISENINMSDWGDIKRKEYQDVLEEIKSLLYSSAERLNEYLVNLRRKMAEFENRG